MNVYLNKPKLDWLPMFLLILSAGSIYFVFLRKELLYLTLFVFGGLFFIKHAFRNTLTSLFILVFLFFTLLGLNFLFAVKEQATQKLFANFVIFLTAIFSALTYQDKKSQFLNHLYVVLKIILIHSLINFIAYPFVKPFLFEISNERFDCLTFYNLFFYLGDTHLSNVLGVELARNQGFFWEPGVLQILLNLLLFIEAFVFKRNGTRFWLTILAIMSTFSTTGLVVMLIQLAIYFSRIIQRKIYLAPIFSLILVGVFFVTQNNVEDKLSGSGQVSFQARFFDLVQPLYILSDNPFTGVGLDDEQYVEIRQQPNYSLNIGLLDFSNRSKGSTNSVMYFLAAAGIPFALIVFFFMYNQQFMLEKRLWFFIFTVVSLMTEPLLLRPFFLTFVMSGGIYFFNKFKWKGY